MPSTQIATFAGGCFWCLEAVFVRFKGVIRVVSGYAGGQVINPTYKQICTGNTGHAEVVQIEFDPERISFSTLLDIFFTIHDPCSLNRQGNDAGTQYRSAIFFHNPEQERLAKEKMAALSATGTLPGKIVTELSPLPVFYPAEDYHQDYFAQNPSQGYCQVVVAPKVRKAMTVFAAHLKT